MTAIYAGPLLFAYSASRIVAHFSSRLEKIFGKLISPLSGMLSYITTRSISRRKARMARIIFLIALTLTLGVYYSIASSTHITRQNINTQLSIGADIKITFYEMITYNESINIIGNISSIDGINEIARVAELRIYTTVSYGGQEIAYNVYGVDYQYFYMPFMKSEYLVGLSRSSAADLVDNTTKIILPIAAKRYYNYEIGDDVYLHVSGADKIIKTSVGGFLKFAPGFHRWGIFELQQRYAGFCLIGIEAARELVKSVNVSEKEVININTILIKVNSNANVSYISQQIEEKLGDYRFSLQTYKDILEQAKQFSFSYLVAFFTQMEFIFSLLIAISGMGLIMIVSVLERRREIALLIVKGASKKEIFGMMIGEAFIITVLAYGLGILVALAYAYGFLVGTLSFGAFTQEVYEFPPGYAMSIPVYLPLVLIIAFIAFLLSALIPTWYVTRRNLASELRIHH